MRASAGTDSIINPLEYPAWDEILLTHSEYSIFHSAGWARVLCESYNYNPVYFCSIVNSSIAYLIPLIEIHSSITGRRAVSLPYSDFCEPIFSDMPRSGEIMNRVIEYGKAARWRYIEWRGGKAYFANRTPSQTFMAHSLELGRNENEVLSSFRDSTRRNIKKAEQSGVSVYLKNTLDSLKRFYTLHCITRKMHGLPPQPFSFFEQIFKHIISQGKGFVAMATYEGRDIAGAVWLHFGKRAVYKFAASDRKYQHLRANNLIIWQAIRWYVANGFEYISFGRTNPGNTGLLQFKRGWGTKEQTLNYYKYSLKSAEFVRDRSMVPGSLKWINSVAPMAALKLAGRWLYGHMG